MAAPDENPYSIPETSPRDLQRTPRPRGEMELASLGMRFGGFVVDAAAFFILYALFVAMVWISIGGIDGRRPTTAFPVAAVLFGGMLFLYAAGWCYLIATRGQSPGKLVVGTQIVTADGEKAGFARIVFLRTFLPQLLPPVMLISPLFIFGEKRQCLHDMFASTYVIRFRRS